MISAKECFEKLLKRKNGEFSEEDYLEQKKECEKRIEHWIKYNFRSTCCEVIFDLPPHPKLISELKELGYQVDIYGPADYGYKIRINLPSDLERQFFASNKNAL